MDGFLTTTWRPCYPVRTNMAVTLTDCELQTFISDRRPGIAVIDYPLDSPACFWTDDGQLYLRVNWSQWCTVSLANKNHVAALSTAHYCRITHSLNNVISEVLAPVFHIEKLPCELFPQNDE